MHVWDKWWRPHRVAPTPAGDFVQRQPQSQTQSVLKQRGRPKQSPRPTPSQRQPQSQTQTVLKQRGETPNQDQTQTKQPLSNIAKSLKNPRQIVHQMDLPSHRGSSINHDMLIKSSKTIRSVFQDMITKTILELVKITNIPPFLAKPISNNDDIRHMVKTYLTEIICDGGDTLSSPITVHDILEAIYGHPFVSILSQIQR